MFPGEQEGFHAFMEFTAKVIDLILGNTTFIDTINATKPDLIIIDNVFVLYGVAIIPYKLKVPVATYTAFLVTVCGRWLLQTLSVCLCVCMSV